MSASEGGSVSDTKHNTFTRRWSIARDGFGIERNDEKGNYVQIDDAIANLHCAITTAHATGFRAGVEAAARVCDRLISGDGICAADGVWIHDCAAAIRAIKVPK